MSLLAILLPLAGLASAPQEPVVYQGRAFVFQADLPAARALGWIAADADDEAVLAALRDTLEARLRGAGRFPEAQVLKEPGGRFAAVFVGDQPAATEAMLIDGLSNPGRVELRLKAEERDLEASETTLAAERERLDAWRAEHAEAALARFNTLTAADGGPHATLRWVSGSAGEPLLLLRAPLGPVTRVQMEVGLRPRQDADGSYGLTLKLQQEPAESLNRRLRSHQGRMLVVVVNDVVVEDRLVEGPVQFPLGVGEGYTIQQARALILAGGIALDVPLTYTERTTRELSNVKRRPEHGDQPVKREDG